VFRASLRAIERAIDRDLALRATANGANLLTFGRTKSDWFAFFADRTGHTRSAKQRWDEQADYSAPIQKTKVWRTSV
jgi:hypothetical protein